MILAALAGLCLEIYLTRRLVRVQAGAVEWVEERSREHQLCQRVTRRRASEVIGGSTAQRTDRPRRR